MVANKLPRHAFIVTLLASPGCGASPLEHSPDPEPVELATTSEAVTIKSCSESEIRAHTPPGRMPILDRAFDWIHRGVWYCQCVGAGGDGYRTDCSGFVSMTWTLAKPGLVTNGFAGGLWAAGSSHLISYAELLPGDALNYPGVPGVTGHIVLFGGWLDDAHTKFCSLEESHHGTQARVIERSVDSEYLPVRWNSVAPSCTAHCEGSVIVGGDCGKGDCAAFGATCVSDSGGPRCASVFCPPTGKKDFCWTLGGSKTKIAHCDNGAISTSDCASFAASCSSAGAPAGTGRCVSDFCVADPVKPPVAHDGCWFEGGKMLHCDAAGGFALSACPAGQQCSMIGGKAHCAAAKCPASGKADVCAGPTQIGHCVGGSIASATSCKAGEVCLADGGGPRCVRHPEIGSDPGDAPIPQAVDTPDATDTTADGQSSCAIAAPGRGNAAVLVVSLAIAFVAHRRRRRTASTPRRALRRCGRCPPASPSRR